MSDRATIPLELAYQVQDEMRRHVVYDRKQSGWESWPEFTRGAAEGVRRYNCKGFARLAVSRLFWLARDLGHLDSPEEPFAIRTAIRIYKADALPPPPDPDHVDAFFWDGRYWRRFCSSMDTDWGSLERITDLPYPVVSWADMTDITRFWPVEA